MGGAGDHGIQRHEIPGYEHLTRIGSGGSSTVFRATDPRHQRPVAIKVLDQPTLSRSGRSAFQREVEAIGRVGHHPYVVTVLGSGFTALDHPYLVLPFFDRGTFGELVDEQGPLTWSAAVDIGVKLSSAVETVHRAGVVHRDIKPSNVFVGVTPEHPLLGDFGISSTVEPAATRTTTMAVTFGYSAPEVLDDERPTPASDIYSLAMTIYRLIQGLHAYYAESPAAIVRKVVAESNRPQLSAGVPMELAEVVAGALAKDPADRPPSALALARLLQDVQSSRGLTVTDVVVADEPPRIGEGEPSGQPQPTDAADNIESRMLAALREQSRSRPAEARVHGSAARRATAAAAGPAASERAARGAERADVGAILAAALDPKPRPEPDEPPRTDTGPPDSGSDNDSDTGTGTGTDTDNDIDMGPPATIDLPTVVSPRKARHDIDGLDDDATTERRIPRSLLITLMVILTAAVVGVVVVLL